MLYFSSAKSHRIIFLKNPSLQLKGKGWGLEGEEPQTSWGVASGPQPERQKTHAFLQSNSALPDRPASSPGAQCRGAAVPPSQPSPIPDPRFPTQQSLQFSPSTRAPPAPDTATRPVSSDPLEPGPALPPQLRRDEGAAPLKPEGCFARSRRAPNDDHPGRAPLGSSHPAGPGFPAGRLADPPSPRPRHLQIRSPATCPSAGR